MAEGSSSDALAGVLAVAAPIVGPDAAQRETLPGTVAFGALSSAQRCARLCRYRL
jgi:hypothetical protein